MGKDLLLTIIFQYNIDEFQISFFFKKIWISCHCLLLVACFHLQASPRLRFNKEGSLLAVTSENGIKILANGEGLRLIRMLETRTIDKNRGPSEPINSKVILSLSCTDVLTFGCLAS